MHKNIFNVFSHLFGFRHIIFFDSYFASSVQVKGIIQRVPSPHPSLIDSLEGEVQAFLIDEDQLHTYDDLTKVNPVTPTTGIKQGYNVTGDP